MNKIKEIDKNTAVTYLDGDTGLRYHSPLDPPFRLYGVLPEFPLRRFPRKVTAKVNEFVERLALSTAGGRVRFRTDSHKIAVRAVTPDQMLFPHMTFVGTSCFDIYLRDERGYVFSTSFITESGRPERFQSAVCFTGDGMRDITIDLPLYDGVSELTIGLDPGARIEEAAPYRSEKPIVFYGSSIVQGGCASRPGNSYQGMISRRFDCDYINLGLAGRAMGEDAIAEYAASLPIELFVYDYDYNAPDAAHLEKTHERFFLKFREARPDVPVIIASRTNRAPEAAGDADNLARREVIRRTYENALKRGDRKVAFIDGQAIFDAAKLIGASPFDCTVEGCHPNDLGFACMAKVFGDAIADILGWEK
ncbi:MAG: hypothetical protein IJR90_02980 [Clostridia bacterium]|nr:hypothetical protein [Clostridia bacterium]